MWEEEGAPLGRWLGARRGWERETKKRELPNGRGLIVLMEGVQKARQKRETWGGRTGQCFLHQGTVLEGARCHCLPTPGTWRTSDP